ncbi:DNA cytosine methyltransferase [Rothia endophytica]|uniref:DNA cytosine methyltransferase n=1 Tax=Rothia endophytica TaxID=1324766 RepID=UPI001F465518|nr:DNA cytosine methyltransferase [Rothia endophytica]
MLSKASPTFRSSLTYPPEEVQQVFDAKIQEEELIVEENSTPVAHQFEEFLHSRLSYLSGCINIASLFSGAGGLDLGVKLSAATVEYGEDISLAGLANRAKFEKLSGKVHYVYSNDLFASSNETYLSNIGGGVVKDSRDIRQVISFPDSDLILGGFPCPGFSAAGPRLLDDPRNFLYIHYIRALMQSKPSFFIAENVKGLMTMAGGQALKQISEDFGAAGYQVSAHLVNSRDYGVPQFRERVFIIGVRNDIAEKYGFQYELPEPTHGPGKEYPWVTLREAFEGLPVGHDEEVFDTSYSSMYMSRNRKKSWDEQSFTIQASGRQAPQWPGGKPMVKLGKNEWKFQGSENRRMSVRECARVQTFPDWYEFSDGGKLHTTKNNRLNEQYKQIGNAVPVLLAEKISRPIIRFFLEHKEILKN